MTAPYTELADKLWPLYLEHLKKRDGWDSYIAGVFVGIGRQNWIMGGQSYNSPRDGTSKGNIISMLADYPDTALAVEMIKALKKMAPKSDYGPKRWEWPRDYAQPKLSYKDGTLSLIIHCETELAKANRDAKYDRCEVSFYREKPNWQAPRSERAQPFKTLHSDPGIWRMDVQVNSVGYLYASGGPVSPGHGTWDGLEFEVIPEHIKNAESIPESTGPMIASESKPEEMKDYSAELPKVGDKECIDHCLHHRDKWTEKENPDHHKRWNTLIAYIEEKQYQRAYSYATVFAAKGWQPWKDSLVHLRSKL